MVFEKISQYAIVFLVAAASSLLITPVVIWIAKILKILDKPAKNKIHKKPVPRLGGMAIFMAYFFSLFITDNLNLSIQLIVFGGMAILLLGIMDDIFRVPAVIKLVYIFGVTFLLAREGIVVNLLGGLFYLNLLISLLWIVGVTSAFNAVDNMDGLASGIGAIAAITFFIIAIRTLQWEWATAAIALCGALVGFLRYNFNPAKIFMGDSGSLFLGFTLAAIGIRGEWSINPVKASIIPILVLGVPIFDLAYIIVRRWFEGTAKGVVNAITFCAKDHLSHRLTMLGLNQRMAVLFIYLIAICVSIGAIVLQYSPKWEAALLLLQFILIFVTVAVLINITSRVKG